MRTKALVVLCWAQIAVACVLVAFNFTSMITRPWPGFDYSRTTRLVTEIAPSGPGAHAGLRVGDRLVTINGYAPGRDVGPLFYSRANEAFPVVVERAGRRLTLQVVPVTQEAMRRDSLTRGAAQALPAINGYLNFALHLWMLGLATSLMVLRPENRDARLVALELAFWAGGGFLYRLAGFGTILNALPQPLRPVLLFTDAVYIAGFFATCLHFAIRFPANRLRVARFWDYLPYAAAFPIFFEAWAHGRRRLSGDVRPAELPWSDAYSTIGTAMLLAALITLAVRLVRMEDANARRRLKLLFLALLPGTLAFIAGFAVSVLQLGYRWDAAARLLQTPATIAGSGIFAYAVVRHRMFNVRVLVRRSIQYALARGTLLALMAMPVLGLGIFLYAHRGDSLAVLLTGTPAVYVLLILPLVFVIRYRRRLLERLDRRFFREQYDSRRLLLHVVSIIRGGSDMLALSHAALDEIDRALHPKHLSLWQLHPDGDAFHRGFARGEMPRRDASPLASAATLSALLSTDDDPLDVHSRASRSLLQRLPAAERDWLRDSDAHLIVPLLIEERMVGFMLLGERKSEEPYSREDRELLRTLGAQLALTLDYTRLKQSPSLMWSPSTTSSAAHLSDVVRLCPRCGRCYASEEGRCEVDGQALVEEPGVPRTIEDKYVVTRLLGRGGMGSVYLATQKRLNRPVAIKVLLSHLVGSPVMRTRFEREARIVARLRHPAIVTIHDFGVLPSGHAYLVMEHLDGETLRKTIMSGAMPIEAALQILKPVGDAIDAAHRAGVVHRDLKPENIMIVREHDDERTPRVLDFGLAKLSGPIGTDDATVLQSGHSAGVVGTLMYMAPEVLSGHVADARSDQYSLAIIAYELFAGAHPLGNATDLASVVRGHTEASLTPIAERIDVPAAVGAALDRALSKDPALRFASVREFVAALEGVTRS